MAALLVMGLAPPLFAAQAQPRARSDSVSSRRAPSFTVSRAIGPIGVDGRLDDPGWRGTADIPVDIEVSPGDNTPAVARAVCHVTYDVENLYLGCRAQDPNPGQIRAHVVDRDNVVQLIQDDLIGVYIDPFNDQRRAFVFVVNPFGVQADGVRTVGDGYDDYSWDAIWSSSGRLTPEGYEVELAIPFKSLRFPRTSEVQTWGFVFARSWPRNMRYRMEAGPHDRRNTCDLCQANKISGFAGMSPGRNLELAPTITGGRTDARNPFPSGRLEKGPIASEIGIDLHLGLTPNVSLNGTVNPDFSQIEADVAQLDVNQRFALSYPEKRPFFLEGADFFGTPIQAVFTRTVADPDGGLKLTGKVGSSTKNAIGLFAARDRMTNLLFPSNQLTGITTMEQDAWTTVGRFRRDLGNASNLGLLYTGRFGTGYANQLGGIDLFYRLGPSTRLSAQYLGSVTRYPDSIATGFRQPRGQFSGGAARVSLNHDTNRWHASLLYLDQSPDFRADVGFVPRVDIRTVTADFAPVWYRGRGWFTMLALGPFVSQTRDHRGVVTDQDLGFGVSYQGPLQSQVYLWFAQHQERFEGTLYRLDRSNGYADLKPFAGVGLSLQWQIGEAVDYANARRAAELMVTPGMQLSLGRGLNLDLSDAFQRLSTGGHRIFTANILQSKLGYNFSVRTMVRAIVQYRDVRRDPARFTAPVENQEQGILGQFLFAHKVNPQTVLFLGWSETGTGASSYRLATAQRTFFAKIGYAWRP